MDSQLPELIRKASQAWRDAGTKLGFRVTAPFSVRSLPSTVKCLAFVPDFGSPKGTLVGISCPPKFDIDQLLWDYAKQNKMFCSFVNPLGYASYDEAIFKDVLEDWGYFGSPDLRPHWLA